MNNCILGVMWVFVFCVSSSVCRGLVFDLGLRHIMFMLTCFCVLSGLAMISIRMRTLNCFVYCILALKCVSLSILLFV